MSIGLGVARYAYEFPASNLIPIELTLAQMFGSAEAKLLTKLELMELVSFVVLLEL